jgi:hypothetical protein
MLIIFFKIKGMIIKNSFWLVKQSILYTTVTFYDSCLKIYEDFIPNFGDKMSGCCNGTTLGVISSFIKEFLTKNCMAVVPHTLGRFSPLRLSSCFSD